MYPDRYVPLQYEAEIFQRTGNFVFTLEHQRSADNRTIKTRLEGSYVDEIERSGVSIAQFTRDAVREKLRRKEHVIDSEVLRLSALERQLFNLEKQILRSMTYNRQARRKRQEQMAAQGCPRNEIELVMETMRYRELAAQGLASRLAANVKRAMEELRPILAESPPDAFEVKLLGPGFSSLPPEEQYRRAVALCDDPRVSEETRHKAQAIKNYGMENWLAWHEKPS